MSDELTKFRVTMLVAAAQNRIKELGEQLAAATQRAEAAEARALEEEAISYDIAAKAALDAQNWREELTVMRQRLDAAEAQLAAVPDYAAYYAAAWEAWGPGSPAPLDFAEWLAAGKPEVQP